LPPPPEVQKDKRYRTKPAYQFTGQADSCAASVKTLSVCHCPGEQQKDPERYRI
jgi:hypothetical protein